MVHKLENINIKLEEKNNVFSIFSYERLLIQPMYRKLITLPYFIDNKDNKYIKFELSKSLSLNGLSCLWTNINEDNSNKFIELILLNTNLDTESVFRFKDNPLAQIIGSKDKIDIQSNTFIGKIYFN